VSLVSLGSLIADNSGSLDPRNFPAEDFELWSIPAFDSGRPELRAGSTIGSAKKRVQPGDVLLSRIVPHIRRAWIVNKGTGRRQIASTEWIVFRSGDFWPPYLRQFLLSDAFHSQFMQTVAGVGGSLLRARYAGVARIKVDLPRFEEQRRIAALLDQTDDLHHKRLQSIEGLKALPRALFIEMFGDPISNNRGWERMRLDDLLDGFASGKNIVAALEDDPSARYHVLKISAVNSSGYDPSQKKALPSEYVPPPSHKVRVGDLLITRANTTGLVGQTVLIKDTPDNIYLPDKILRFVFSKDRVVEPGYIHGVFQHASMREVLAKLATGTSGSMKNISQAKLLSITVAFPAPGLQRRFAAAIAPMDELLMVVSRQLQGLEALSASLRNGFFSGEVPFSAAAGCASR
jgi:type I restriction enzyme S subunit